MSFTTTIKEEISRIDNTKSESISELSGFLRNNGECDDNLIELVTENATVAKRIYKLIKDIYDVTSTIETKKNSNFSKNNLYLIDIEEKVDFILEDLSVMDNNGNMLPEPKEYILGGEEEIRAYLRGAFLSKGSINDPKTARYHLEYLIEDKPEALVINDLLNTFDLNSKVITRDKGYMVYVKEAEKIGDFLRIINANNAVLYYEDIRIYRDHKNMTNRLNNMEQANMDKVVATATKQIEQIEFLKEGDYINLLDDKTQEAIEYRLKYPEASLTELAEIISYETRKPITKSGLNHRFRKINELIERINKNS